MILEPIKADVLAVRVIPNVDPQLARDLKLQPHHTSIGMITCNIDDSLYAALDDGTKAAEVDVVYARSFYAGADHASGPFSGEIIGIYAAANPEEISSGIQACLRYIEKEAWFYAADRAGKLGFFPHVIPRTGRYLSDAAGVEPGTPMAYLIAPPIEAVLALDAALKVADVEMKVFYEPPSETNFSGGLLVGDLASVEAAAKAFQETVLDLAARPQVISPAPQAEELAEQFGKATADRGTGSELPYALFASGMELAEKPAGYTHLFDNRSLVGKDHPVVRFRGQMDLLQGFVIDAAVAAAEEGHPDTAAELEEVLEFLRKLLSAEVTGRPMPHLSIAGFDGEELHRISHNTGRYLNVGWVLPHPSMGQAVSKLNLLRAQSRQAELAALEAFAEDEQHMTPENRDQMLHGLNRLSNALYVVTCKLIGQKKA